MGAALFTTGPYLDMALSQFTTMPPRTASDGAIEWRVPLNDGAVVHIALEDCGKYTKWLFDNALTPDGKPGRANGMDLAVATEHVRYEKVAEAFTKVTGKPARFVNVSEEEYFSYYSDKIRATKFGKEYAGMKDDDASIMTFEQNFTGFWRMWQACGGSNPLIKRDYKLLDEILPDRIRTVEEWFERNKDWALAVAEGKGGVILKMHEDAAAVKSRLS
jgi:hypothetical protein